MRDNEENMSEATCHRISTDTFFEGKLILSAWVATDMPCEPHLKKLCVAKWSTLHEYEADTTFGYCPKCGTRLGFTEDRQPTEEPR